MHGIFKYTLNASDKNLLFGNKSWSRENVKQRWSLPGIEPVLSQKPHASDCLPSYLVITLNYLWILI